MVAVDVLEFADYVGTHKEFEILNKDNVASHLMSFLVDKYVDDNGEGDWDFIGSRFLSLMDHLGLDSMDLTVDEAKVFAILAAWDLDKINLLS